MFDQTFSYVLAIAALVIGVMLLTGHGSVFMKGGNTQARAQKYDEKKMEKFSGICLILIGIATGVDAFTESMAAKIAYVVILFVILAVFLFLLRTKSLWISGNDSYRFRIRREVFILSNPVKV